MDDRGDAGVEDVGHGLRDLGADAGVTGGDGLQPQEHEGADDLALDARAHAGGVRADDVALELGAELMADVPGGERAEAGGDPVDGLGLGGERVDDVPGGGQGLHGLGRQLDAGAVTGDVDDVLRGRAGRAEDDCLHIHIQHPTD